MIPCWLLMNDLWCEASDISSADSPPVTRDPPNPPSPFRLLFLLLVGTGTVQEGVVPVPPPPHSPHASDAGGEAPAASFARMCDDRFEGVPNFVSLLLARERERLPVHR